MKDNESASSQGAARVKLQRGAGGYSSSCGAVRGLQPTAGALEGREAKIWLGSEVRGEKVTLINL